MTDYNYLNKLEWIVNLDMLLKPDEIEAYIKNMSLALFSPNKNTDVTKQILIKQPDLYTNINDKTIDSDRQHIYNLIRKSVTMKNGGYVLINGLIKIQNKLMDEEKDLVSILNKGLTKDSILGSIYTDTYNLNLLYKNIETDNRNIPKNINYIKRYINDYLEINNIEDDINFLGIDNKESINYNEIVENSVLSVASSPIVDLNKACIGTMDEIVDLVDEFFKVNKYNSLPAKIKKYINNYISIYIKDKNLREDFILQNIDKYYFINYKQAEMVSDSSDKTRYISNVLLYNNINYPKFSKIIQQKFGNTLPGPIQFYKIFFENEIVIRNGKQIFLYVYLLFVISMLKGIAQVLEKNNVNRNIVKRICDSYDSLYVYIRNAYSNYFGLTGGNSPYHVDDVGITEIRYDMSNTEFRKNIKESKILINWNEEKNEFNGINKEIMRKILYTPIDKDLYTKKINNIAIGGIILRDIDKNTSIIKASIEIINNYYKHLLNNKKINIAYINEIQRKMENGIHISEVQKILIEINSIYKMVINGDRLIKQTLAMAGASMLAAFLNILLKKNYEIIEYLINIESIIDNYIKSNNTVGNNSKIYQKTLLKKSKLLLDLLYTQYRIMFFEKIYEPYYKYLSNKEKLKGNKSSDELPMKYMTLFTNDINKITSIWNKKLTILDNQDLVNIYKRYAYNKLTNPNNKMSTNDIKVVKSVQSNQVTVMDDKLKKEIMSDFYWKKDGKMYKALGGKIKILVPYVNSYGGHGLIDIYQLAFDNKKTSSWSSKCLINGDKITVNYIENKLKDKGWIIVGNTVEDVDNSKMWRCLVLDGAINKIPTNEIRLFVYNLIMNNQYYIKNTGFTWPDTSNTKLKIMNYCSKIIKKSKYSFCYILVSRIALYNLVSANL